MGQVLCIASPELSAVLRRVRELTQPRSVTRPHPVGGISSTVGAAFSCGAALLLQLHQCHSLVWLSVFSFSNRTNKKTSAIALASSLLSMFRLIFP
jgi:hypothetical protein